MHRLTILLIFALISSIVSASILAADEAKLPSSRPTTKGISLFHMPPKEETLPYPGQPVRLKLRLAGTKDTTRKLRVLYVRDGRLTDFQVTDAELNETDQPVYDIPVQAPLAEMVYYFMLYNPDDTVITSSRYVVRRNCIPNIDLSPGSIEPELQGIERLQKLVNETRRLEQELLSYDRALKLVEKLQRVLSQ